MRRSIAALATVLIMTALGGVVSVGTATSAAAADCLPESAAQGAIGVKYRAMGGAGGPLGCPTSYELTNPDGTGKRQVFAGGTMYWSNATGAHPVWGKIGEKWGELGWEGGQFGYPVSDELTNPDNVGKRQQFQGGTIYWSHDTGAHPIWGAIGEAWGDLGWEGGDFGYPVSDVVASPDGVGVYSEFQRGWIYWSPGITCTVNAKLLGGYPNARAFAAAAGKSRCGEQWRQIRSRVVAGRYQEWSRVDIKFCHGCPVGSVPWGSNQVSLLVDHVQSKPNDWGMLAHELTHAAQSYRGDGSGWVTEGIADWLRYDLDLPPDGRGNDPRCEQTHHNHYTQGYECGAALLGYIQRTVGGHVLPDLNAYLHGQNRSGDAIRSWIQTKTGRTPEQLWSACRSAECAGGRP